MTDAEITLALAEKVMGWHQAERDGFQWWLRDDDRHGADYWEGESDCNPDAWHPLESDAHACAVLDKMRSNGWGWAIYTLDTHNDIMAAFEVTPSGSLRSGKANSFEVTIEPYSAANRRRAICIAALKAVGAWQE